MSKKPATPRYDALRSEALKTPFDFDYLKIWAALLETEAALTAEREARQDMELKFGALALETAKAKDDLDEEREARKSDALAIEALAKAHDEATATFGAQVEAAALERAAKKLQQRSDDITHENCMQDPETGVWEGGGEASLIAEAFYDAAELVRKLSPGPAAQALAEDRRDAERFRVIPSASLDTIRSTLQGPLNIGFGIEELRAWCDAAIAGKGTA